MLRTHRQSHPPWSCRSSQMRQRCRFDNVPIVFPETPAGIGSSIPFGVYLSLQVYFGSFSVSSSLQVFLSRLFRCSPEPAIPRPSLQGTTSEYKSLLAQELAQAVLVGGLLATFMARSLLPYSCMHLLKPTNRSIPVLAVLMRIPP